LLKSPRNVEDSTSIEAQEVKLRKCSTATNLKPLQLIASEMVMVMDQRWSCLPTPGILGAFPGHFILKLISKRSSKKMKFDIDHSTEMFLVGSTYYIKQGNTT
jgi:hypothetical protein